MRIRRRGGQLLSIPLRFRADQARRISETFHVYGPVEYNGRKYAVALYYPKVKFWRKTIAAFPYFFLTQIHPSLYLRVRSYTELVEGMLPLDLKARPVPYDQRTYRELAAITLVWLDIYLTPFFAPKLLRVYRFRLLFMEKVIALSKDRRYPRPHTVAERVYFQELKKADSQVVQLWKSFKNYLPTLDVLVKSFIAISEKPSDKNASQLRSLAKRMRAQTDTLADWFDERAKSWPEFVDAHSLYVETKQEERSVFRRYSPRAIFEGTLGVILDIASGGSIPISAAFTVASHIGISYMRDLLLKPKWQAKSLRRTATSYRRLGSRIDRFLTLYNIEVPARSL